MYENVRVELARQNIGLIDLLELVNQILDADHQIRYQTLSEKLRGNSPLLLREAIAIKKALGVDMPLEELFSIKVAS